jgi:hypothetical protein
MNEDGELSPFERMLAHQPNALKKVNCSSGLAEENISAPPHLSALKCHRSTAVLQNAIDQGAVDEGCSINDNRDAFERLSLHYFHPMTPEKLSGRIRA